MSFPEQWRPVDGWPNHEVSDLGRVRRVGAKGGVTPGKIIQAHPERGGYLRVLMRDAPRRKHVLVHRMVALAFLGHPPGQVGRGRLDFQVNHKNGIKTDNRPDNLEWVTHLENKRHGVGLGLFARGEDRASAKLTDEKIREIRARYAAGEVGAPTLGREYGVSTHYVQNIIRRRRWAHVT